MLRLLYPTERRISDGEVIRWAMDIKTDHALEAYALEAGAAGHSFVDDATVERITAEVQRQPPTLSEAIDVLEDAGKATFAGKRDHEATLDRNV